MSKGLVTRVRQKCISPLLMFRYYYYYYYLHVFSGISFLPVGNVCVRKYTSVCKIYKWKSFRNYFSTDPHHQHYPFNLYFHNVSSEIIYSIWKENNFSILPHRHFYTAIVVPSLSVFLFSVFGFINVFELTEGTPKNGLLFFIRIDCVAVKNETEQRKNEEGAFLLFKMFPFADINNKRKCLRASELDKRKNW